MTLHVNLATDQPGVLARIDGLIRESDVDTIYEIGPGRVLSGLTRVNGFKKEAMIYNVNLKGLRLLVVPVGVRWFELSCWF